MATMTGEYYYGVGRRKTATAQVRLYTGGTGTVIINDKPLEEYFTRRRDIVQILEPLQVTETDNAFNITVLVRGGGVTGQAGAVRHGIARALLVANADYRPVLRKGGYLTRDARAKERKKPGLKRARKRPQYTKR
jgi:small subunit ribosomal protein S9